MKLNAFLMPECPALMVDEESPSVHGSMLQVGWRRFIQGCMELIAVVAYNSLVVQVVRISARTAPPVRRTQIVSCWMACHFVCVKMALLVMEPHVLCQKILCSTLYPLRMNFMRYLLTISLGTTGQRQLQKKIYLLTLAEFPLTMSEHATM
jgi:hypothetical protein